jgi:hypothetical protein
VYLRALTGLPILDLVETDVATNRTSEHDRSQHRRDFLDYVDARRSLFAELAQPGHRNVADLVICRLQKFGQLASVKGRTQSLATRFVALTRLAKEDAVSEQSL